MSERATPPGTRAWASRHVAAGTPETSFRPLGRSGLLASAVGFGCYRVDERATHGEALARALLSGCNVVDTSSNYTDGASERAVGAVLRTLLDSGDVRREEVIVVSKVGYLQGENLRQAIQRETEGRPHADIVRYADGCWHCIHPDFVREQLALSLSRLGLPSIDAYLLHNPEYFLSDAAHRGVGPLEDVRSEFYRRIKAAFEALEGEVDAGRIGAYGVSSNTFVSPATDAEATSVARMLDIARDVARERRGDPDLHRFAVIQLPFNLLEPGAFVERGAPAGDARTPLETASAGGLGVLVNRPLNGFHHGRLVRLADFPVRAPGVAPEAASRRVGLLEAEFRQRLAPRFGDEVGPGAGKLFAWGEELGAAVGQFAGYDHWRQVEEEFIRPRLAHVMAHLSLHLVGSVRNDWTEWRGRYEPAVEELLSSVGDVYRERAQQRSDGLKGRLQSHVPAALARESLSRQAIAVVAGSPGVSSVLVGMRRPEYVEDALGVLALPAVLPTVALFRSLG